MPPILPGGNGSGARRVDEAMQVEIWSDVVCPWCYLGRRHLELALAARGACAGAGTDLGGKCSYGRGTAIAGRSAFNGWWQAAMWPSLLCATRGGSCSAQICVA